MLTRRYALKSLLTLPVLLLTHVGARPLYLFGESTTEAVPAVGNAFLTEDQLIKEALRLSLHFEGDDETPYKSIG